MPDYNMVQKYLRKVKLTE